MPQAGEVGSFSVEQWTELGWDAMYFRGEVPDALARPGITAVEVRASMSGVLAEYNELEASTLSGASCCNGRSHIDSA